MRLWRLIWNQTVCSCWSSPYLHEGNTRHTLSWQHAIIKHAVQLLFSKIHNDHKFMTYKSAERPFVLIFIRIPFFCELAFSPPYPSPARYICVTVRYRPLWTLLQSKTMHSKTCCSVPFLHTRSVRYFLWYLHEHIL